MIEYSKIMKMGRRILVDMYNRGYADGQTSIPHEVVEAYEKGVEEGMKTKMTECSFYKRGIEDALNKVKWLFRNVPNKELFEGNYVEDILNLYTWEQIEEGIRKYEDKQTDEMSLKDAINWMKDYFRTIDMPMPQYDKAFEMAIKSMEYIDDHAL